MQITIDTNNLSELDVAMLAFLAGQEAETPEPEGETTTEPEPAKADKKAKAEKAKPEPEPEPEEDLVGGGPTLADAVARATQMVSNGGSAKVKEALAAVGAKRVSEMDETDVPAFLAALDEE